MEKAKYGKMRQVTAVNGSQMVVKLRGGLLPSGEGEYREINWNCLRHNHSQAPSTENSCKTEHHAQGNVDASGNNLMIFQQRKRLKRKS